MKVVKTSHLITKNQLFKKELCEYNYLCLNNNKKTVYLYIHCDNED